MRTAEGAARRREEAKLRQIMFATAFAWLCTPLPASAQADAAAPALDACVAAAGASRVALEGCKGAVAEPCIETEGGETTAGMYRCYDAEMRAWTSVLDAAVARAQADDTRAPLLLQAQETWRAWRQAECRYQASLYAGGSLERVLAMSCLADLTADRAIALIYAERTEEL